MMPIFGWSFIGELVEAIGVMFAWLFSTFQVYSHTYVMTLFGAFSTAVPTIDFTSWVTLFNQIDYFFPLSETFAFATAYFVLWGVVFIYRLVKSWIPLLNSLTMAITFIEGLLGVGDGKSFVMVNRLIRDFLQNTKKEIYTTCPCDGEQREWFLAYCFPQNIPRRDAARERLHFLYPGEQEAFAEFHERPVSRAEVEILREDSKGGAHPPVEVIDENPESDMVWVRCPWPTTLDMVALYKEQGVRLTRKSLGMRDRVEEFWHFTPAGCVIVVDETADIFGSDSHQTKDKEKRAKFKAYLRQHRHFHNDLFFCAQNQNDVDVAMRRLFQRVLYCRNLKKVPFLDHWSVRGLRWPIQVFEVREFLATQSVGKSGEQILKMVPVDGFKVLPKRREFKNYRSFSAAAAFPGKALAMEGTHSSDMDTPWDRIKGVFAGLWVPVCVLTFMVVIGFLGIEMAYGLCGVDSGKIGHYLYGNTFSAKTNVVKSSYANINTNNPAVDSKQHSSGVVMPAPVATGTNSVAPALVVHRSPALQFISPTFFRLDDGSEFRAGDLLQGRCLLCWNERLVSFTSGPSVPWGVLFPGQQDPGQ